MDTAGPFSAVSLKLLTHTPRIHSMMLCHVNAVVEEANFDWSGRVEDAHWIGHTHFPRGKLAGVVIINFSHA